MTQKGYEGAVAVVTGGASGIGAAVVDKLRVAGARVLIADLTPAGPDSFVVDVADAESVAALAVTLREQSGRCDLLVNSAGVAEVGNILECSEQAWARVFDVNVRGVWQTSRHVLPLMPVGSAIVNVASGAGLRPIPNMAAYVASKAAVIGLSRAMALDHAASGIRVNCVCPGLVDTPLAANTQHHRSRESQQAVAEFDGYLVKRLASAEEIADAVCYLGSPAAGYVTGATLAVDGGRTLH